MPTTIDTAFLDTMPANVAVQFFDRVAKSPGHRGLPLPARGGVGVGHLEAGRRQGRGARRGPDRAGHRARAARRHRLRHPLRVDPGRPRGHVRRRRHHHGLPEHQRRGHRLHPQRLREPRSSSPRTTTRSRSSSTTAPSCRTSRKVVTFDGTTDGDWVISLDDLAALGAAKLAEQPGVVKTAPRRSSPDQLATLIYTSGTTGRPKGVRLRHKSWVYEGEAIRVQNILDETDLQFLWLPMAHSFGKVLLSAQLACGFASAVDGRVEKIVDNCAAVKPTFMGAAPRIFEKAYGRIQTMQAAEGGAKEKIFHKAFAVGLKVEQLKREGKSVPLAAQGAARPLRQARLQQGARALRWTRALLHLRLRRPQPGDRRVVQRRRHRDPRGLRHDRELRGRHGQPPRRATASAPSARPLPGSEVKIGDGDEVHAARPARHGAATTTSPRRRPARSTPRAGCTPATRARSTPTATSPSPAGSRSSSRPPAASTSPRRRSSRSSRRSAPTPASSWSSATSATTSSRWSPSTPTRWPAGPPRTAWRARPTPTSSRATPVNAMVSRLRRRAQRQAQPLGDHQEVGAARPRPHDRVR